MHKNVFMWILIIGLLFLLWFVTRTKSEYSSSSSSFLQTGDTYKDDVLKNVSDKVNEAIKKLPKEEQDKLKTMNIEDLNNKLYQIDYEVNSTKSKPLYTITG